MPKNNENNKKVYVRPVDVAEFIYNVLDKKNLMSDDVRNMLETTVIDFKNEKFEQLAEKWGVNP